MASYTIRVICNPCELVSMLPADEVVLHYWTPFDAGQPYYSFTCPRCGVEYEKFANERTYDMLRIARCPAEEHVVAEELLEPHVGEPMSYDDIIDLHHALADDSYDWTQEMTQDG